ncbi:MAG TPA: hypothetical protein VFB39_03510 [Solirubrobacteraceae bacterium]|nr:hypothetical protein [Solirubrobacteraceae bacterium]
MATQRTVGESPASAQGTRRPLVDFGELDRGEVIAVAGGALLAVSVFLAWFTLGNSNASLNSCRGPSSSCTAWQSMTVLRYFLLAAAVAPIILAWIIVRGHALSWPRGEMTAVIAIAALTFIIFRGLIDKPGQPSGQIGIDYGWFVALLGGLLILAGSIWRSRESGARRKPPGVL